MLSEIYKDGKLFHTRISTTPPNHRKRTPRPHQRKRNRINPFDKPQLSPSAPEMNPENPQYRRKHPTYTLKSPQTPLKTPQNQAPTCIMTSHVGLVSGCQVASSWTGEIMVNFDLFPLVCVVFLPLCYSSGEFPTENKCFLSI